MACKVTKIGKAPAQRYIRMDQLSCGQVGEIVDSNYPEEGAFVMRISPNKRSMVAFLKLGPREETKTYDGDCDIAVRLLLPGEYVDVRFTNDPEEG